MGHGGVVCKSSVYNVWGAVVLYVSPQCTMYGVVCKSSVYNVWGTVVLWLLQPNTSQRS